jgi:uncharacterized repeat protein (TIGR01451 family)
MSSKRVWLSSSLVLITVGLGITALAQQGRAPLPGSERRAAGTAGDAPSRARDAAPHMPARSPAGRPAAATPASGKAGDARPDATRPAAPRSERGTANVSLQLTAPAEASVGIPAKYELMVRNEGEGSVDYVRVEAELPQNAEFVSGSPEPDVDGGTASWQIGKLEAGAERRLALELRPSDEGQIKCTAMVVCSSFSTSQTTITRPQLAVTMTAAPEVIVGERVTFVLKISNPGTAPASNVTIYDEVPEGTTFMEASDGGQLTPDKKSVRWNIGPLPQGQSRTVTITLRPTAPGEIYSQSIATADGELRSKAESSTVVEGISALLVEVVDIADPIEVGAETTYEVRVVNQGSQAATNLVLLAEAPLGMTPVKANGPARAEIQGQRIVFDPLPRLAARADTAFHIRVRGDRAGDHRFHVQLTGDQLQSPVHKEESTRVYNDDE